MVVLLVKIKNVRQLTIFLFTQIGFGLIFLVLEGDYCLIERLEIDRILLFKLSFALGFNLFDKNGIKGMLIERFLN